MISKSLAVPGALALLTSGLLLIIVSLLVLILLLLFHLLPVVHLILTEALIQVLVDATLAAFGRRLRITASCLSSAASDSITPATRRLACIHL